MEPEDMQVFPPGVEALADPASMTLQPACAQQVHAAAPAAAGPEPDSPADEACAVRQTDGRAHAGAAAEARTAGLHGSAHALVARATGAPTSPALGEQHATASCTEHSRPQLDPGAGQGPWKGGQPSDTAASEGQHSAGPVCGLAGIGAALRAVDGLVGDLETGDEGTKGRSSSDEDDAKELHLYIGEDSDEEAHHGC